MDASMKFLLVLMTAVALQMILLPAPLYVQGAKTIQDATINTERLHRRIVELRTDYGKLCKCVDTALETQTRVFFRNGVKSPILARLIDLMEMSMEMLNKSKAQETRQKLSDKIHLAYSLLYDIHTTVEGLAKNTTLNNTQRNSTHTMKQSILTWIDQNSRTIMVKLNKSGVNFTDIVKYVTFCGLSIANANIHNGLQKVGGQATKPVKRASTGRKQNGRR